MTEKAPAVGDIFYRWEVYGVLPDESDFGDETKARIHYYLKVAHVRRATEASVWLAVSDSGKLKRQSIGSRSARYKATKEEAWTSLKARARLRLFHTEQAFLKAKAVSDDLAVASMPGAT